MSCLLCPRFPLPSKETEHTDVKKEFLFNSPSKTLSNDNCLDENGDVVSASDPLNHKNKAPHEDERNDAVMVGNSALGISNKELTVQADYIENSITSSCSGSSENSIQLKNFSGIVKINAVETDNESYGSQGCSCSTKMYSDCGTQTDKEIRAINEYKKKLSKNDKLTKKSLLSWLNRKCSNIESSLNFKISNQKFSSFFGNKSAEKLVTADKMTEISRSHHELNDHADKNTSIETNFYQTSKYANSYYPDFRNSEASSRNSFHTSDAVSDSNTVLEKHEIKSDGRKHILSSNNVHSSKANFRQLSKSDSDALTLPYNLRFRNQALKNDSVFLDSSHIVPRNIITSLNDVVEPKEFLQPIGDEAINDEISQIHSNNRIFIEHQFESEHVDNSFIRRKKFEGQNSIKNNNSFNSLHAKTIFCFNDSDFLSYQSDISSSDSDEVFIRPHTNDERLDNGMQITKLGKGSNISMNSMILSKNYYQSEEYPYNPPPSLETLHCQASFTNASSEISLIDTQKIDNSEKKISKVYIDTEHSQENSDKRNHNVSLDYGVQYQSKTSGKKSSEAAHVQNYSECNIIRSDSKSSSGYHSLDQDSQPFPKRNLRINSQNEVHRSDTETEAYRVPMVGLQPKFSTEFESTSSDKYSQRNSFDGPHAMSSERESHYEPNNRRNRNFSGDVYPSYKVSSAKECLCNKMILPQHNITDNTSIMKPLSNFSIKKSAIQKAGLVQESHRLKPEDTYHKQVGVYCEHANNYEYPKKARQLTHFNGAIYNPCRQPKNPVRKKTPVSNTDESNYTTFKFYDFIDGPLTRTSRKSIKKAPICADK